MRIRFESVADHEAFRAIHIAAFANHPFSNQTEHSIVEGLREADALTVSLVAELNGQVVGHIAFSPALVDGEPCAVYALGPVGVLPPFQRRGIGTRLVESGLVALGGLDASACVLVGDPAYYGRFGFRSESALSMEGVPPEVFLCLPVAGPMPRGRVTHHKAFSVGAH